MAPDKLPEDFAILALTAEVERRKRNGDYRCTYGRLVAATTKEQREQIVEEYRRSDGAGRRGGTRNVFLEREKDIIREAVQKAEKIGAGE